MKLKVSQAAADDMEDICVIYGRALSIEQADGI